MPMTLGLLAVRHGCELRGDPDAVVERVATLGGAGPGALSFLANPQYRQYLAATRATAIVLGPADAADCPVACLVSSNPYLTYARMAADLHPEPPLAPGIAPSASVATSALVPASCQIDPGAVIGAGVSLGEHCVIGANAVIGAGCQIGPDTRICAGVVLYPGVRVGARGLIHSGVVLGADGFGVARDAQRTWTKVPQVGSVRIGDDVEIGAKTTIDRGAIEDTDIGDGVKLDNQIQIGHNVVIGSHTAIAGLAGVAGSTRIGARCIIGGDAVISGHLVIVDDVVISGGSRVVRSIDQPGLYGGTLPAEDIRNWRRNAVRFGQLDDMARRLQRLEALLGKREGTEP